MRALALLPALCGLLLAGCVTPPAPPSAEAEPEFGRGGQVVEIPGPRQRLLDIALQEWELWGRGRLDASNAIDEHTAGTRRLEHHPGFVGRVLMYWFALRGPDFPATGALHPDGSLQAWSAVFISYLMRSAGIGPTLFPPSLRHWDYIKRIHDWPDPAGFEARDAATTAPRPGDVICAPRAWTAEVIRSFDQLAGLDSKGTYHCDLVVSVADGLLGAIGGNVRDGVTWTEVRLDAQGVMVPTPGRPWIAVLWNNLP